MSFPPAWPAYVGAQVLHPGSGQVLAIRGEEQVRAHAAMREFRLKVKVGDVIEPRESVGEDVGHLLYGCESPAERDEVYREFRKVFGIEVG